MSPIRHAGFAMLDVLIALLLLATTLGGACVTLIQTMRSTHSALLTTRAVDLATDLVEEARHIQSTETATALLVAWRARVGETLPVAGLDPEQYAALAPAPMDADGRPGAAAASQVLTLRWRGTRGELEELSLPMTVELRPEAS